MLSTFLAHCPREIVERINLALRGIATFLVGGTTRDLVGRSLGHEPGPRAFRDLDLTCAAPVGELEARLREAGFRPVPVGRQFEVVKIVEPGLEIDVAPLRKGLAERPPAGEVEALLLANLSERDLTLNAMAVSWPDGRLIDPLGGREDLRRRRIRSVGDPADRFAEDPLRILRAARFSGVYGFPLDEALPPAMAGAATSLRDVAPERLRAEIMELLAVRLPSIPLRALDQAGALRVFLPELAACAGVAQNRLHRLDVLEHALLTCDLLPPDGPLLRLAALLHDVGKPEARRFSEMKGDYIFYGHQEIGADLAAGRLRVLRFSGEETACVTTLVREHMFKHLTQITPRAVRRWLGRLAPADPLDAAALMLADTRATSLDFSLDGPTLNLLRILRRTRRSGAPTGIGQLAIGGRELIEIGLEPGPLFSRILAELLEIVLEDPNKNEKDVLIAAARRLADEIARGEQA